LTRRIALGPFCCATVHTLVRYKRILIREIWKHILIPALGLG
jgi:hypothetical protein